jgi:hypothetical protein
MAKLILKGADITRGGNHLMNERVDWAIADGLGVIKV